MAITKQVDEDRLKRTVHATASAVALSDTTDLAHYAYGLLVVATGNVKFNDAGGNAITLTAVAANTVIPVVASRVWATGTTATVLALD